MFFDTILVKKMINNFKMKHLIARNGSENMLIQFKFFEGENAETLALKTGKMKFAEYFLAH